ncbi:MAG: CHASE domain-containing sensor histidine kinase [Thermoplasmatota archaeon]
MPFVVGLILGAGVASAYLVQRMNSNASQARFNAQAGDLSDSIGRGLETHIALVQGAAGLFNASEEVDRLEWMRYVEVLHLHDRYPGTPALFFARAVPEANVSAFEAQVAADPLREPTLTPAYAIWPPSAVGDRLPFDFLAPAEGLSRQFGYDLLSNDAARAAVEKARDQGNTILSQGSGAIVANVPGKVVAIVQAVYAHDEPLGTVAERRHAFLGVVGAVIRMDPTINAVLSTTGPDFDVEVALLGPGPGDAAVIFDRNPSNGSVASALRLTTASDHNIGGEVIRITVGRSSAALSPLESIAWVGALVIYAVLGLVLGFAAYQWQTREARAQRLAEQATTELREGAVRLDEAQEVAQMGSWDVDVNSGRVIWSLGLCRLLGVDSQTYEPRPESLVGFVHPEDRDALKAKLAMALESAVPLSHGVRIVRADGEVRECHIQLRPAAGPTGKVERLTGTMQDVSRQRSAQAAIEEAFERRRQVDKLAAAQEERAKLFNVMAHELSNPLSPIQLQLHLLRNPTAPELSAGQAKSLEMVERSVGRLARLVGDIRDLGRIHTNSLKLVPKEFDLAVVVRDAVDLQRPVAENAKVHLDLQAEAAAPVTADPDRVAQVITNLLSNAIKYSPPESTIKVTMSTDGDGYRVVVADQGPGMDSAQVQRLFAPFSQVQGAGTQKPGTGLGLYVSRGLMEAHGGKLWCDSEGPGTGTTFTLQLPRKPSATAQQVDGWSGAPPAAA